MKSNNSNFPIDLVEYVILGNLINDGVQSIKELEKGSFKPYLDLTPYVQGLEKRSYARKVVSIRGIKYEITTDGRAYFNSKGSKILVYGAKSMSIDTKKGKVEDTSITPVFGPISGQELKRIKRELKKKHSLN